MSVEDLDFSDPNAMKAYNQAIRDVALAEIAVELGLPAGATEEEINEVLGKKEHHA